MELIPRKRKLKPKQMWLAVCYMVSIGIALLRYVIRHPRASQATLKFILSELTTLPQRLTNKVHIDERQVKIKQDIAECAHLFSEKSQTHNETSNLDELEWLDKSHRLFNSHWALVYVILRTLKPALVVETGVAEGESTAYILQAIADNGKGFLHSIDLPNQVYLTDKGELHCDFNLGIEEPGCLVQLLLREQWNLHLGKSRDILPRLLTQLGQIGLFLHDSEHRYETMTFEYECAWTHIQYGGYLVSDDVTWNTAFSDFAKRQGLQPIIIGKLGFIKKPRKEKSLRDEGHRYN